jgi:hypothetical protein
MIPGNRPEDTAHEEYWQLLQEKFDEKFPEHKEVIRELFEGESHLETAVCELVDLSADMSYAIGFSVGLVEQDMAKSGKQESEWMKQRCAVCGEQLGTDYDRAEVVLKQTKFLSENPHLIVHAETCFNDETMEQA